MRAAAGILKHFEALHQRNPRLRASLPCFRNWMIASAISLWLLFLAGYVATLLVKERNGTRAPNRGS